jgi:hypothetical protein
MTALITPLYRSSNGDAWLLEKEPNGEMFVIHQPNRSSGGRTSRVTVADFLAVQGHGPEYQALHNMLAKMSAAKEGGASI